MTETYFLTEKLVGETYFSKTPIRYVTYTTPSPQDKDWKLCFYAIPAPAPTHYYRTWRFIDDEIAKQEYPIFRELAMKRNWEPVDEVPDPIPTCRHDDLP